MQGLRGLVTLPAAAMPQRSVSGPLLACSFVSLTFCLIFLLLNFCRRICRLNSLAHRSARSCDTGCDAPSVPSPITDAGRLLLCTSGCVFAKYRQHLLFLFVFRSFRPLCLSLPCFCDRATSPRRIASDAPLPSPGLASSTCTAVEASPAPSSTTGSEQ